MMLYKLQSAKVSMAVPTSLATAVILVASLTQALSVDPATPYSMSMQTNLFRRGHSSLVTLTSSTVMLMDNIFSILADF